MRVVVFGSIKIRSLPVAAQESLRRLMKIGAEVLVGDAWGVDSAVQRYLHQRGYRSVQVYHRAGGLRNNVGAWPTTQVSGSYTDRDRRMCTDAEYGLAVWDGTSRGSGRNIEQLGRRCRVIRV